MTESTAYPGPTSRTFFSQRLRLHYVDWGNPDAPPLVLLHGGRDHCRSWDWVATALRHSWHIIAPDLRGHGDSQWSQSGYYDMAGLVYDLAQLVDRENLAPITFVGHSLGGNVGLRFTGVYPDKVRRLVAIEGLGPSPQLIAKESEIDIAERMRTWIEARRQIAARPPHRYGSVEAAFERMQQMHKQLSREQAMHLTQHGVLQNEDGTFSWKFDNYVRASPPYDMTRAQVAELWAHITCPTLLVHGADSWASNPQQDGRAAHFRNVRVVSVERAGHWVHHDQFEVFVKLLQEFL